MYNKKIQLLRNGNIYTPSNGATALQTAMSTISQMQGVSDGEVILARYRESQNSEVKTLLCIHYEGSTESGWTFLSDIDINSITQNFVRRPAVLYETDGTTGIIGVNGSTIGDNWQLTGYDFSPYKYLKVYIKESDFDTTSNYLTPSVVIELPLDAASLSKSNNSTSLSGHSSYPANDVYLAGANVTNPNDQNVEFTIIVAVDTTKTKFQVVCQNSLYGTTRGDRNRDGRYVYKIEGCYDTLNDAIDTGFVCKTKYVDLSSYNYSSPSIDPYQMNDLGTVNVSTLQVSFNTAKEVSGYTKEYTIRFVAGQNLTTVTLPQGVLWANGTAPTFVTGHTYEINVVNNCAVVGEFY